MGLGVCGHEPDSNEASDGLYIPGTFSKALSEAFNRIRLGGYSTPPQYKQNDSGP